MLHPILDISNFNVVLTFSGKTPSPPVGSSMDLTSRQAYSYWSLDSSRSRSSRSGTSGKLVSGVFLSCGIITDLLVPSFVIGALLGPFCTNLINPSRWSGTDADGEIAYVSDSH